MHAARNKADGVAKLLIEEKADLDAKNKVRPVGRCICVSAWRLVGGRVDGLGWAVSMSAACMQACMHACMHVQRCISRSLPRHADLTHLHHHRDCRHDWVRSMERRR